MGVLVVNEGCVIVPSNAADVDGLRRNRNGCSLRRIFILPAVTAYRNYAVVAAAVKNVLDGYSGTRFCDKLGVLIPLVGVGRAGNIVKRRSGNCCVKSVIGLGHSVAYGCNKIGISGENHVSVRHLRNSRTALVFPEEDRRAVRCHSHIGEEYNVRIGGEEADRDAVAVYYVLNSVYILEAHRYVCLDGKVGAVDKRSYRCRSLGDYLFKCALYVYSSVNTRTEHAVSVIEICKGFALYAVGKLIEQLRNEAGRLVIVFLKLRNLLEDLLVRKSREVNVLLYSFGVENALEIYFFKDFNYLIECQVLVKSVGVIHVTDCCGEYFKLGSVAQLIGLAKLEKGICKAVGNADVEINRSVGISRYVNVSVDDLKYRCNLGEIALCLNAEREAYIAVACCDENSVALVELGHILKLVGRGDKVTHHILDNRGYEIALVIEVVIINRSVNVGADYNVLDGGENCVNGNFDVVNLDGTAVCNNLLVLNELLADLGLLLRESGFKRNVKGLFAAHGVGDVYVLLKKNARIDKLVCVFLENSVNINLREILLGNLEGVKNLSESIAAYVLNVLGRMYRKLAEIALQKQHTVKIKRRHAREG